MIFSYNRPAIGDTLLIVLAPMQEKKAIHAERRGNIVRITEGKQVLGWNIFHISQVLPITGRGQIHFDLQEIAQLNDLITDAGFDDRLPKEEEAHFVVGDVKTCVDHPDSDHLKVTETEVDHEELLQIVCGAPNIAAGQKVVVAKPGAMMPDGTMIWPGKLRGVESSGMICSARELQMPNAPQKRGILVLPAGATVGSLVEVPPKKE
ncbi:MAG: DUF4479 and tRNA-binding domain-containing protein [Enterococcaceae bacterium]|jgi:tRNA-binding protein|nr:DUF4479 and tRNA-binding domain-containing protein [Enterococcaceae bacterium]MCI1919487.1 DUF4479 and tRNA-binding domain-containing protein [Enterococcaceae bacterium]